MPKKASLSRYPVTVGENLAAACLNGGFSRRAVATAFTRLQRKISASACRKDLALPVWAHDRPFAAPWPNGSSGPKDANSLAAFLAFA